MLRLAILLLGLEVFTGAIAGSPTPPPSAAESKGGLPHEQTQSDRLLACGDKRGSDNCPFVIRVIGSQDQRASENIADTHQDKTPQDSWLTWFTGALSAIALLQAVLFWWNTRTVKRQMRAYVFCEAGAIINVADPIQQPNGPQIPATEARLAFPQFGPSARVKIRVSGQTPAYGIVHWGNMVVKEFPLQSALPGVPPGSLELKSNLGPAAESTKGFSIAAPLSSEQIAGIRNGTQAIYVYGHIKYRDTFGASHWTKYRLMHNIISGNIGISTDLTYCEEGNEADQPLFRWL